jgi:aldehyde:ferredoxin oxidoreductase
MDSPEGRIEMQDYYQTKVLTKEDVDRLLDDYYEERGWDLKTGRPTKERLERLGLTGYEEEVKG